MTRPRKMFFLGMLCVLFVCLGPVVAKAFSQGTKAVPFVNERPRTAYDFLHSIGVNTHLNYYDRLYGNFDLVEQKLKILGIKHLRDGAHVGTTAANEKLYSRWRKLGDDGIRFNAVVDPRDHPGKMTTERLQQIDDLSGHTIESFEGPNELDVSTFADWPTVAHDYQRDLFQATKAMNPTRGIRVIGTSLAHASNASKVGDLSAFADYGNLHPYPAGKIPSSVIDEQVRYARIMYPGIPLVFSESGYHNALNDLHSQPPISEAAGGKYVPRLFLEDFLNGITRTYLYELLDQTDEPEMKNLQRHWGLVRFNGTDKPAYTALKNLIDEVSQSQRTFSPSMLSLAIEGQTSAIHHLLLQKTVSQYVLILWQEVSSYDLKAQKDIQNPPIPVTVSFQSKVSLIAAYEPYIQANPIKTFRNSSSIAMDVPDHPLVLLVNIQGIP